MSTVPTELLDPTAATEAALDIESIKELMDAFDPASLLPELGDIFSTITTICQIAVMVGPILLLVLGLSGLILSGIMLLLSAGFPDMTPVEMVWRAFWCLIWQAVIALLANGGIWLAAFLRFDARGNFRKK